MRVKVVSLNLWWGGNLFPAIIDFLKSEGADIVLLQEVFDGHGNNLKKRQRSMEVLKAKLAYPYRDFAKALMQKDPEGKVPSGNAVLSKLPIKITSYRYLFEALREEYEDIPEHWPIFPRVLQHVELDTPAGPVNIFNMHGVWDLAGNDYTPDRQKMIQIIIEETANKPNVILGGDSNASQGNPLWQDISQHLKNVFDQAPASTFNMRRKDKPGYGKSAVDVMFVSPNIKVVSKDVPDVDISDHLPLVVSLDIA